MPHAGDASPQENAMIAKLYCKTTLPAPYRIVVLGNPAVKGENIMLDGLRTSDIEEYEVHPKQANKKHRQFGHDSPSEYHKTSPPLVPNLKASGDAITKGDLLFPEIPEDLFTWMPPEIDAIELGDKEGHNHTLKAALLAIRHSEKHFHEVNIQDDPAGYGSHYDWRFFKEILTHDEHRAALHSIARAWQQFAEQAGIIYWYAHGSLLGHYWNGLAMPWDADHDIQVPVMELDRLARDFNHTLVIQHPTEGCRKYLLDVNPYYVQRSRGNGRNVIDARFMDIDTGVYIDITGLARNNPARIMISCKNRHFYQIKSFNRIRRSLFEGYPALIPSAYESMLKREYRTYSSPVYKQWRYNDKIRLWEFKDSCSHYLSGYRFSNHVYCYPQDLMDDPECFEKYGTCDHVSWAQYNMLAHATERHINETSIYDVIVDNRKDFPLELPETPELDKLLDAIGFYYHPMLNTSNHEIKKATIA